MGDPGLTEVWYMSDIGRRADYRSVKVALQSLTGGETDSGPPMASVARRAPAAGDRSDRTEACHVISAGLARDVVVP